MKRAPGRPPRSRLFRAVAASVVLVLLAGLGVAVYLSKGYDAQESRPVDTAVWVTRASGQYGRVNTDLKQLDSVRDVDDPSGVAQSGRSSLVFSQGYRKLYTINPADPATLAEKNSAALTSASDAAQGGATPSGTRSVQTSGDWLVFLTDVGKVYEQRISAPAGTVPSLIQTNEQQSSAASTESGPDPTATSAVAVDDVGRVALYSAGDHSVRVYDADSGRLEGSPVALQSPPPADARVQIGLVAGSWAVLDPGQGKIWLKNHDQPFSLQITKDAIMGAGSSQGDRFYVADTRGLSSVLVKDGASSQLAQASGTPAPPTRVGSTVYAAWLGQDSGSLWSQEAGLKPLQVPDGVLAKVQNITPRIASNGQRAVLQEADSGQIWALPDGAAIPLSQWDVQKKRDEQTVGQSVVQDVTKPEPPVARNSSFGVRSGSTVLLPVLLNSFTPMKNVALSIVPGSVSGALSSPGFGQLSLSSDNQQVVARISARSGSASFTYVITDGNLKSAPATVTLHVVPPQTKADPVWCGIENCLQEWPRPQMSPGGTVSVPVMNAWVDPSGDALALLDAKVDDQRAPIRVVPDAAGQVVIRHTDPNAPSGDFGVTVTVGNSSGRSATKQMTVHVEKSAPLQTTAAAVVTAVNEPRVVNISKYVSGGSGSYRLLDASISQGNKDRANAAPNGAAGTIRLVSGTAGEYTVGFTVQDLDSLSEASGTIRFSVSDASNSFSLPPVTAFVRQHEDTTLDLLGTVQNTSGRVLALTAAASDNPRLKADVLEAARLRIAGDTDNGLPGLVGQVAVTVTDGHGTSVRSQVSVFMVPGTVGLAPIARPDAVTVRAGEQVDIPVTLNDTAPRGENIVLHPTLATSGAPGELAFVSGSRIRYLAPGKPGTYSIKYSEFLEADPSRTDTATVTVTVTGKGTNHPPEPVVLSARVVTGGTIVIPVADGNPDADGDPTVVNTVDQPRPGEGTATISPDGTAITYRAPGRGSAGGQFSFAYSVKDSHGAVGTSRVRVNVMASQLADVAPVTYTDSIRGVRGSTEPVTVQPLDNDRDPAGGTLELVSVVPNAARGSAEFTRLQSLIDPATDLKKGVVRLRPGAEEGVQSFVYTVRSSASSSTAEGLIVLTVAPDPAPDSPVVTDTVVTMGDRSKLEAGLDVVTGRVAWPSGDVSSLTLSVWGEAAGRYTVQGHSIRGPIPQEGALVPFRLTGKDRLGKPATGYGFLRIPAFNDMHLQLLNQIKPITVTEDQTVHVNVADIIDLSSGDRIELNSAATFDVQRANASCVSNGNDAVDYSAGRGAPWTDACTLQVRVAGQDAWTSLPFPVAVIPRSPQPLLNSVSRIVAPGTSQTIDLYGEMTSWDGGRTGDPSQLNYAVSFAGSNFTLVQNGHSVTVTARADAHPGARESAVVTLPKFAGQTANLTLEVGAAPPDAPRGATFSKSCSISSGPSCSFNVIGVPGEYDPFLGKSGAGLKLVGLGAVSCPIASVSTNGSEVRATWNGGPRAPGGSCVIPFSVADAQGRTGMGQVNLDVQGYPAPPSSISTSGFTGNSVTLAVTLGDAALAHPAVTTVEIMERGQNIGASCSPGSAGTFLCVVSGLKVGEQHTYTARAVNATGESTDTTPVTTWAYAAPAVSGGQAITVYDSARTNQSQGVIQLDVQAGDDAAGFQISVDGQSRGVMPRTGASSRWTGTASPGSHTISVTPVSRFQPPMGHGSDGTAFTVTVVVAGSPVLGSAGQLVATSNTAVSLQGATASANSAPNGVTARYAVWPKGQNAPPCTDAGTGWQTSPDFSGLTPYTTYQGAACFTNGFGTVASPVVETATWVSSPAGKPLSYTLSNQPRAVTNNTQDGHQYTAELHFEKVVTAPNIPPITGFTVILTINGHDVTYTGPGDFVSAITAVQLPGPITYRYCFRGQSIACGDPAPIAPTGAPTLVDLSVAQDPIKEGDVRNSDVVVSAAAQNSVSVTTEVNTDQKIVTYHVVFSDPFSSFNPKNRTLDLTRPLDVPKPTPTPTPTGTETTTPPGGNTGPAGRAPGG